MSRGRHARQHRRWLAAAVGALFVVIAAAAPAQAHLPVFLTSANTATALPHSPLVPDGTVSFAFYGRTSHPGDTRAVRIRLKAGQEFHAELLIPALAPEATYAPWQLPRLAVVSPRGRVSVLRNDERRFFFEPFTQTSYFTLAERTTVAVSGTYALIVIGTAPTRFVAVSGEVEQFTAAIENATIGTVADVQEWYRTPPG